MTQRSTWWALWRGEGRQRKRRPPNNNKNGNILDIFALEIKGNFPFNRWCTANEGPVRTQYKFMVPIYVLPETKLHGFVISNFFNVQSPMQFPHSCICERFIYFRDRSAYFAAAKYRENTITHRYINVGIRNEAVQFHFWECINQNFGTV